MNRNSILLQAAALAIAAGTCAVAGIAYGQSQPGQALVQAEALPMDAVRAGRFHFLDLNGDGLLTPEEVPSDDIVLRSQFSTLDRNDDGRLTVEEYAVYGKPLP